MNSKKFYIYDSFTKLIAYEAKKLLIQPDVMHFDGDPVLSIAIIHKFLCSRVYPIEYSIVETSFFKKGIKNIKDKKILAKIDVFKKYLRSGDQRLNNPYLDKEERFVTANSVGYFDRNGRFLLDFLSEIVGIRHFHVGYNKHTDDTLLFVRFVEDTAFILSVGNHKDIHVDTGKSIVFDAIAEEFPLELDSFFPELKGILPPEIDDCTLDKVKMLKSGGVTTFFPDRYGKTRMLGIGFSSARTPTFTAFFLDRIIQELHCIFFESKSWKWFDSSSRIISIERIKSIPYLISSQRAEDGRLRYTFSRLHHKSNITKLIDILDCVYFSQGQKRKTLHDKIQNMCSS